MRVENLMMQFHPSKRTVFVAFETPDADIMQEYIGEKLKNCTCEFIKPKEKRSLDANGYYWALVGKLSEKLQLPKSEIYRNHIREVGAYETVCLSDKAVDKFIKVWQSNGLGWVCETVESKLPKCTNVLAYYGSSQFSTSEMSRLINLCVEDCKAQGIETMTPAELQVLVGAWE